MSRFPLNRHDAYRIQAAREVLAAPVDMGDDRAMAGRLGRLEVALEQLLAMLDEPAGASGQDVPPTVPDGGTGVTVTLVTVDHGPVTMPEPTWCAGHADHRPETYRVDLDHKGPEHHLTHDGEALWVALLTQAPYATLPEHRGLGVYVDQQDYAYTLDPAGLYALAASMDTHADRLRDLADRLAVLLAGGEPR